MFFVYVASNLTKDLVRVQVPLDSNSFINRVTPTFSFNWDLVKDDTLKTLNHN